MAVLERSELQASSLSDLHAIADQLGIEGFRRLRKAELINSILGDDSGSAEDTADAADAPDAAQQDAPGDGETPEPRARRRRPVRVRRSRAAAEEQEPDEGAREGSKPRERAPRRAPASETGGERSAAAEPAEEDGGRVADGVVEVLGNGSAFLRVDPPEPSDADVYISAAQVRRCELVSGDRVSGPVRTPRRSERYPSLVRVEAINGAPADTVSDGSRYDELAVDYPQERLALGSDDPTLKAIEWLTPLGHGSRAVIVGARHSGKTETLRRLLDALGGREELNVTLVLAGARPEEIEQWREGSVAPTAALTFAASPDSQDQAVERALDGARRIASRGSNALVLIDGLDGLHPHAARKALAAARNLRESGSLTIIATASRPLGGETTVIALDGALTSTGRQPILDLVNSGTLRAELLVGEDGAEAITKARAAAIDDGS
ncbi:MAG: transcription termination factor Rho [Solirubrobacteraceae bacterium]|jgi:transcription termination factor Rho|nr:transcription termination factor Rho [Solirubrobacteraceae bacterium]